MTARLAAIVALVGLVGVVAGLSLPTAAAVGATVGVVGIAALALGWLVARPLRDAARQIDAWLAQEHHEIIRLPTGADWQRLETALNALGAAYQRRGLTLRRDRPWRRELVDALVSPALLFSVEGRLLAANDPARALLRMPEEARMLTVLQTIGSEDLSRAVREVRDTAAPVTLDITHRDRELRAVVSPVGDELLVICTDRTRERQVEELRRDFVVNASHELKTPVTSIQTLAEALAITLPADAAKAASLVTRLREESERLARLAYDLLELRRLEDPGPAGHVPVDLVELTRATVADLSDRAGGREIDLAITGAEAATVTGAEEDLRLVVSNLVANAIQYNRPGGTVEVAIRNEDDRVVLVVRDSGIGIPHADLPRIFERFYRVDAARSRATGGTGLGLSLVRHAVERHGGTISVDSVLGEGTTVAVTLPVRRVRTPDA